MMDVAKFDWFVVPFTLGFSYLILWLVWLMIGVFKELSKDERREFVRSVFSKQIFGALKEIFNEVLIHRSIFKINPLLGYMHLCFAFGWLMLIVFGKVETLLFTGDAANPLWYPLFFKYFEPGSHSFMFSAALENIMDFWLLFILSGQMFAILKRFFPHKAGIKIKTRHSNINRITLMVLWFVFPLRLAAESVTVAMYGGGGFLTGSLGTMLSGVSLPGFVQPMLWWCYSIALGLFFVLLPKSRYLHIPLEGVLIILRRCGVSNRKVLNRMETLSCSACGLCLDVCPLARNNIAGVQPVYFIERLRDGVDTDADLWKCLGCTRCASICPVMVHSHYIRQELKELHNERVNTSVVASVSEVTVDKPYVDVVLFSGCMGRLNPSTKQAMDKILDSAGISYHWVDGEGDICCGRPLQLGGRIAEANAMKHILVEKIKNYNFKNVVSTCPICYNMLKGEFDAGVVLHHTQYLKMLNDRGLVNTLRGDKLITYHDPCELGRGANVVNEPLVLLENVGVVLKNVEQGISGSCCGGGLSAVNLTDAERQLVAASTAMLLDAENADVVVTACPLCKKTLMRQCDGKVRDIAEVMSESLVAKPAVQKVKEIKSKAVNKIVEYVN